MKKDILLGLFVIILTSGAFSAKAHSHHPHDDSDRQEVKRPDKESSKNKDIAKKEDKKSMLGKLDSNNDGVISKSEFIDSKKRKFDKIDSNNDGKLTKGELDSYKKKRKESH